MMAESIHETITNEIFSGRHAPGAKIVERTMAEHLGVSRMPIRETLIRLVAQGALVGGKGQGAMLHRYSAEDVQDLYDYREAIEGGAASTAAKRASETDLARMRAICEQMETRHEEYGTDAWGELDRKFHETMATSARNRRFLLNFQTLVTEGRYSFYLHKDRRPNFTPGDPESQRHKESVIIDHRQLLDALIARNADLAGTIARRHIRASSKVALDYLISRDLESQQD
jgi:DNA-binding GntR family transcriptional regulator